jgi:hypothetical protein
MGRTLLSGSFRGGTGRLWAGPQSAEPFREELRLAASVHALSLSHGAGHGGKADPLDGPARSGRERSSRV